MFYSLVKNSILINSYQNLLKKYSLKIKVIKHYDLIKNNLFLSIHLHIIHIILIKININIFKTSYLLLNKIFNF